VTAPLGGAAAPAVPCVHRAGRQPCARTPWPLRRTRPAAPREAGEAAAIGSSARPPPRRVGGNPCEEAHRIPYASGPARWAV